MRKVIRIKIDLVLAAASVKVFLSFFAQSEKFFGKKSFFIFPGGFFSLTSCRNLLKDLKNAGNETGRGAVVVSFATSGRQSCTLTYANLRVTTDAVLGVT